MIPVMGLCYCDKCQVKRLRGTLNAIEKRLEAIEKILAERDNG